jgi:hypothetical protein
VTAPPRLAPLERYDTLCGFCEERAPSCRLRGKACCATCAEALREAGMACAEADVPEPEESKPVALRPKVLTDRRIRQLIRYVDFCEHIVPIYEMALTERAALRGTRLEVTERKAPRPKPKPIRSTKPRLDAPAKRIAAPPIAKMPW